MLPALQFSLAESLSDIWSALHKDVELTISDGEVHYLRMMAVTIDDDVASYLLLRKLRRARIVAGPVSADVVAMNSFLEFVFDGGPSRFCQLGHPTAEIPAYGLPVTALLGAGLVGLRAGQTILWPDERGTLCDLSVVHVENCPGLTDWLGAGGGGKDNDRRHR